MSSPMDIISPLFPHCLLFLVSNHLFKTLIDTGSDDSFIDTSVVELLSLRTRPSTSIIGLASASHQQPSFGITQPLVVTPVTVTERLSYGNPLPPHAFEVLDLDENEYQFIIGIDLIPLIFPENIPITIACRHFPSRVIRAGVVHVVHPPSSLVYTTTTIVPIHNPLPITPLEGEGHVPLEEEPVRVSTSTSEDKEQEYQLQRNIILNMPHINDALKINEAITGFCNLPMASLQLKLDSDLVNQVISILVNILLANVVLTLQLL